VIGNIHQMRPGYILIDSSSEVLYVSSNCKYESFNFLKEKGILDRVAKGDFNTEKWDKYIVTAERIRVKNQMLYMIELNKDDHDTGLFSIAYKDVMSGLYNRNMWEYMLDNGEGLFCHLNTLVIIDIDNLKEVNDIEGHAEGDRYIRIVADSIKESIREKDIALRYGGDEFIILMNDLKSREEFIHRIRRRISRNSNDVKINVSIGVATFHDLSEIHRAFQKADCNLYEEKQRKKSNIINTKYEELLKIKMTIEEMRSELNDLIAITQNNLDEEIINLSTKLDNVIYEYLNLEKDIKSRVE